MGWDKQTILHTINRNKININIYSMFVSNVSNWFLFEFFFSFSVSSFEATKK